MLKCEGCNNFFGLYHGAYIHPKCEHTTCEKCTYPYRGEMQSTCCQICLKQNLTNVYHDTSSLKQNPLIKVLKTNIEKVPYLAVENYIVDYQLQEINVICSIHKYPSVSYSIDKTQFVCEFCKDDDKYSLTIKEIIDIKLDLLTKKESYIPEINATKTEFEENYNIYKKIHTAINNNTLFCDVKEEILKLFSNESIDFINEISSIFAAVVKSKFSVKKLYDIYDDFNQRYKELTTEIEKNKAICTHVSEIQYNLKDNLTMRIRFEPPVNPKQLLSLKEKYKEVELKVNFELKEMLNQYLDRIMKLNQAKAYATQIESVFEKFYVAMLKKKNKTTK